MKWAEIWGSTAFIKMVRDGKELSTDLKETIMGLDQEGYSACKIAEFLSLNLHHKTLPGTRYCRKSSEKWPEKEDECQD